MRIDKFTVHLRYVRKVSIMIFGGKENRIIIIRKRLKTSMWVSSHGRKSF